MTGGAMGIGLGIATRLAQAKAKVLIADLDELAAKQSADGLTAQGYQVKTVKTDVASEDDVIKMVNAAVAEFGSLDILVNNAGIYPQVPLAKMTLDDFQKVINVNLRSVFLTTEYASKPMIT